MMVARNAEELNTLKDICLRNCNEERFQTTTFVVFDTTLTDLNYQRFIEYQANAKCAQQHGFADQQQSHAKCASDMLKEWIKEIRRGVFETYVKGQPMTASAMKMPTVVNSEIAPAIFSAGPESLDIIKIKFSKTYWKKALVKDTVKSVISFNTKTDIIDHCKGPAMHVPYLLQDSVNEDLTWKKDVAPEHPLYQVCKFVENKIKHADKSNTFNLAEKFIDLTKPPYGLFQSYAGMGMLAFAMRPYIGKIFDLNGKPREALHVVEDVVEVFKSWEDGRVSPKVTFRFETPEEGKLCKAFIRAFNLTAYKDISEISSLKNARWVMTHSYITGKKYPLWSLKYVAEDKAKEEVRTLVDKINAICVEIGSSNPNLMSDALDGLKMYEFEFKNLISDDANFRDGFLAFLQAVEAVSLKTDEFDTAVEYISSHLQSEVGTWNEKEVVNALKDWRLTTRPVPPPDDQGRQSGGGSGTTGSGYNQGPDTSKKKSKARSKVDNIVEVNEAKAILQKLIDLGYDQILNTILDD